MFLEKAHLETGLLALCSFLLRSGLDGAVFPGVGRSNYAGRARKAWWADHGVASMCGQADNIRVRLESSGNLNHFHFPCHFSV